VGAFVGGPGFSSSLPPIPHSLRRVPRLAAALRTEANYFERDAEPMRYLKLRKQ
jgi:hypothetical protein